MDSISSIAQISRLIKSKPRQEEQGDTAKSSSTSGKSQTSTNARHPTTKEAQKTIADRIMALPKDQQSGQKGVETLVTGIMNWKFGDNASNDILLQKSTTKIVDAIINSKKAFQTTQHLIRELVDNRSR